MHRLLIIFFTTLCFVLPAEAQIGWNFGDRPHGSNLSENRIVGSPSSYIPSIPVVHPSSGNFVAPGGTSAGVSPNGNICRHQIPWTDENVNWCNDVIYQTSTDPSAVVVIFVGGTSFNAGDLITLHFIYNSVTIPVTYTVKSLDSASSVANGLVNAIKANQILFNAAGGQNIYGGGYANGNVVGYTVTYGATGFAFDYNSTSNLKMSYTVTGTGTETLTFNGGFYGNIYEAGGSTQSTAYQMPDSFDNNPVYISTRYVNGKAPSAGSVLMSIQVGGATTGVNGVPNTNYGQIGNVVCNSTAGSLESEWIISAYGTGSVSNQNSGVYVGGGVYSNYGGAPCNGGTPDMGAGTFDAGTCYYIYGLDSLCTSSNIFQLSGTTNRNVQIVSQGTGNITFTTGTGSIYVGNIKTGTPNRYLCLDASNQIIASGSAC